MTFRKKFISISVTYFITLCLIFLNSIEVQTQSIMKTPITPENFPIFDKYIRDYAPADSSFNVIMTLANRQRAMGRFAVARAAYMMYGNLFPQKADLIAEQIRYEEIMMLCQTPTPDIEHFYAQYAIDSADTENGYLALQRLADRHIDNFRFDSAAALYKSFLPYYPTMRAKLQKTIDILEAPVEHLNIRNMREPVNSSASEWDPNPTPDGRYLYFSTSGRPGGYGGHDVFVSKFENGKWQTPFNVGPKINGPNNETIDNISADGNIVLLSGDFEGTFGKFDIYLIRRTADGWGPLEHPAFPINTQYHEEGANITADGRFLLFTSDRPGGIGPFVPNSYYYHGTQNGNMDIYVSEKTEAGWSEPINLGPTINTPYAERAPFLHPDGKTLYFSSDGHPGLGRMDVFKSVRLRDDSWTEWSEPVNLGKEINTTLDDWGYKVSVSGDSAFFARQKGPDHLGGWDLYTVNLPQSAKPEQVVTIKGKVLDQYGKPLEATILWENLTTGMPAGTLTTDPNDGTFIILLPLGRKFGYYAEKQGYYSTSDNIDLTSITKAKTIEKNIILVSLRELNDNATTIRLNNIFFDFDKFELKSESIPELKRLIKFLNENNNINISIEGHTDNVGTKDYNNTLSKRRADAIKKYLVDNGIPNKRCSTVGFGSGKPIADNNTDEGRAENRRVEIRFLK